MDKKMTKSPAGYRFTISQTVQKKKKIKCLDLIPSIGMDRMDSDNDYDCIPIKMISYL